jgi:predicted ATPase/class 3 adenylate cyclase/DNA-binding NarL/FixJ family response regulator
MTDLPTGTVTFLFTDIEGSTHLWEQHPAEMRLALARHDALLHHAIEMQHGTVIKSSGDGVLAVFANAVDALAATLVAQRALHAERWGATGPLRVRMALHTGTAEECASDYFGPSLNRTARLLAVGHGGQIVLSRATWELVADHLPVTVEVRDLGVHRLKDLSRPEQIFQLVAPNLPTDFPALRTLDAYPANLPIQPTALIGREQELATVGDLLRRANVRLVTLTGPGGTGKTRLAMQVAAELLDSFTDGVWFVDLAPIRDADLVIPAIMQTMGVKEQGHITPLEQLQAHLRDKQLLLLLDNFEQVVDAAPRVAELLAAAPQLKILVTSRVVLHLRGEQEFAVPPLALPGQHQLPSLEHVSQYAAVALFIARAQAVKPDFVVTNQNAPAVAEICVRLDGLPLAIELAAARSKLFAPEALLKRLERRLGVLTGGPRDAPTRQQTIRNTIDWSYQLLDEGEQTFFRRLGVFVGGCTLEAAEAVCNADGSLPVDVVNSVAALIDKSLLRQQEGQGGESRFVMLETIREYALERLAASGEEEAVRRRHAAYFLALAGAAEPYLASAERPLWLEQLEMAHDNLRAVLVWSQVMPDDGAMELRLASSLWWFWYFRGYASEGRGWLEDALERTKALEPTLERAKVLCGVGALSWFLGNQDLARARLEESATYFRQHENQSDLAYALTYLGLALQYQFDFDAAQKAQRESVAIFRRLGDRWGLAVALDHLAEILYLRKDYAAAHIPIEESQAIWRALGDRWGIAWSLALLGFVVSDQGDMIVGKQLFEESVPMLRAEGHRLRLAASINKLGGLFQGLGDVERAVRCYEESLALFRELGSQIGINMPLYNLGYVALQQGDDARAEAYFVEGLEVARQTRDQVDIYEGLEGLAGVAGARGYFERAARLFGAVEALRTANGHTLDPADHAISDRNIVAVRAQMDAVNFAAAWAAGWALPLEQAISEALEPMPKVTTPPTSPVTLQPPTPIGAHPAGLTTRELDVLRLIAQGLTNAQVAERLVVSAHTVHAHLRAIYGKLDVTSRAAATRFAVEHHLL